MNLQALQHLGKRFLYEEDGAGHSMMMMITLVGFIWTIPIIIVLMFAFWSSGKADTGADAASLAAAFDFVQEYDRDSHVFLVPIPGVCILPSNTPDSAKKAAAVGAYLLKKELSDYPSARRRGRGNADEFATANDVTMISYDTKAVGNDLIHYNAVANVPIYTTNITVRTEREVEDVNGSFNDLGTIEQTSKSTVVLKDSDERQEFCMAPCEVPPFFVCPSTKYGYTYEWDYFLID